jgi:hypothetical protein
MIYEISSHKTKFSIPAVTSVEWEPAYRSVKEIKKPSVILNFFRFILGLQLAKPKMYYTHGFWHFAYPTWNKASLTIYSHGNKRVLYFASNARAKQAYDDCSGLMENRNA